MHVKNEWGRGSVKGNSCGLSPENEPMNLTSVHSCSVTQLCEVPRKPAFPLTNPHHNRGSLQLCSNCVQHCRHPILTVSQSFFSFLTSLIPKQFFSTLLPSLKFRNPSRYSFPLLHTPTSFFNTPHTHP